MDSEDDLRLSATKKSLNPEAKIMTTFDMKQFINKHLEVSDVDTEGYIPFYDIQDEDPKHLKFTVIFASKKSISR